MPVETERSKFIVDLLAEVDAMDESLFPSTYAVEPKDTVVGEASPWTRKLFALMRMYSRELKQLKVEIEFDRTQGDQYKARYAEIDKKVDTLAEILWGSIRSDFQIWTADSIGMRANWKIVTTREDHQQSFKRFLGGILGSLE